jgi:hypothetical protein
MTFFLSYGGKSVDHSKFKSNLGSQPKIAFRSMECDEDLRSYSMPVANLEVQTVKVLWLFNLIL